MIASSGLDLCDLRQWYDWLAEKEDPDAWEAERLAAAETETQTSPDHA